MKEKSRNSALSSRVIDEFPNAGLVAAFEFTNGELNCWPPTCEVLGIAEDIGHLFDCVFHLPMRNEMVVHGCHVPKFTS